MSIELTDIPTAVADYLDTQVVTTISPVVPKSPTQDVLTPGRDGTFTVTATNGDPNKGVRLLNATYHLRVTDDSVLKLIPPNGVLLASFDDVKATKRITDGKARSEMFVRLLSETILDAGAVGTSINIDVHCVDQGDASVTAHLHADIDQNQLFPNSRNKDGRQDVEVV